jgi:2-keto-4-pentenoate hydratase
VPADSGLRRGAGQDTGRDTGQDAPLEAIARAFVEARLGATPLPNFPGTIPADMATAYRCQDIAIDLWPDELAGWKVGRIPPDVEGLYGSDRLAGPIFRETVHYAASGDTVELPVYVGGFAAIEAEFVIVVDADAPPDKLEWSREETAGMIRDLRIGMEMASSPLATINDLGPAVVACGFGNNAGLVVGPSIANWRERDLDSMTCAAFIDGQRVGTGGAFNLTGGPIRSLQFMLELAARRGRPLRAGHVIATGQTSGIHDIRPGQTGRIDFGGDGSLACRAIPATAAKRRSV